MNTKINQSGRLIKVLVLSYVLISASVLVFAQKSYTEKNLYGNWKTKVKEPVDGKCTILVTWYDNHTTDVAFYYKNAETYYTNTKWSYDGEFYNETYNGGQKGKAIIKWVNKNKFKLIIIENQDTDNYKGRVRVFKRTK